MSAVRRKPFERGNGRFRRRNRRLAASHGFAIQVHRAGATLADTAAVLRPLQFQDVADHPQKGHIRGYIDGAGPSIHCQLESHEGTLLSAIRTSYHTCFARAERARLGRRGKLYLIDGTVVYTRNSKAANL